MGAAKTDGGEFTTGVADKEEEQLMLQLFPNPNSGNPLIVKTAALGNSATLAIYNLQGDLVANHPLKPDGLTTIDVSALSNAVYLCRVTSPATVKTIRLVIQR